MKIDGWRRTINAGQVRSLCRESLRSLVGLVELQVGLGGSLGQFQLAWLN